MSESKDPLDGADIGETATVSETVDLYGINMAPDVFFGSDRFGDADIVDVEIVETDGEDYNNIKVTWEGEMTKQLPLRWDYHREPVTEEEKRVASRRKWLYRGGRAAAVLIPMGLATWLAAVMMRRVSGEMTINGEPVVAPTFAEMLPAMAAVLLLSALIMYGLKGGFPGMARPRY